MLSLQNLMRTNAASCITFGALFALQPDIIAAFLGADTPAPTMLILILGMVLMLNGLHLVWASKHPLPQKILIWYFSAGDYLWVIASIILMISKIWITTPAGIMAASAVAVMVGLLGVLQMRSRKALDEI